MSSKLKRDKIQIVIVLIYGARNLYIIYGLNVLNEGDSLHGA